MGFTYKINYLLSIAGATWAIFSYEFTIIPLPTTTRHIYELWHIQVVPQVVILELSLFTIPQKKKFIVIYQLATYLVLF